MLFKENNIKDFLFKEAQDKKEYRKKIAIHETLFEENENREKCLEEDESLEKEAMSQQAGGSTLKNSGWNTNWQFKDPSAEIEKVKQEVYQKAYIFFANLQGQFIKTHTSADLRPNNKELSFIFHYYRTILPSKNEESNAKAQNALNVLENILPGFQDFQQEIEGFNIPLNPYFMISKFSRNDGGVDESNLQDFILTEQGKSLVLPDGRQIPTGSHYQEHINQNINRTNYIDRAQTFPMKEIDSATSSMLKQAIADRIKDGYALKPKLMGQQDSGPNLDTAIREVYNQKLSDSNLDYNNPEHQDQISIYSHHYGKLVQNIYLWLKDQSTELTAFGLKLILKSMVHTGGSQPNTPPDQFRASVKTLYAANGWDSSPNDPNTKMLTLPPLRQLPRGEVVYDRGNGNMGYDHLVLNWKNGLSQIMQKWGPKCDEWMRTLQNIQGQEIQQSPEAAAAWQNTMSSQSGNRTGAEALLDLFKEYPNWNEFNKNHIQKSLASEIRNVNKLSKNQVALQSFQGGNLPQQIQSYVQQILQTAETDPKTAHDQLTTLSTELVQHYMKGDINWKNLTLALHSLNTPIASAGIRYKNEGRIQSLSNGLTAHPTSRQKTMLDEQGFEILKQYGYQVGKMMDFLSSIMYRSCHEQVNTPRGVENFFGHKYSTSSGNSQGGDIILSINYDQLEAKQTQENQVDVYEKLRFSLGQRSGTNDEPILLRSNLPWEQMINVFNEMYPEAGYQLSTVDKPINDDLNELELNVKEAINNAKGNIQVIYHNNKGDTTVLSALEIAAEEMVNKEEQSGTNLIDETQENIIPQSTQSDQPTPQQDPWSMDFEPNPSATEIADFTPPVANEIENDQSNASKPMADPVAMPFNDPNARYIQKKDTKGRRLLRQRAKLESIEEKLQKAANKLDVCGEFKIADKIDLIIKELQEDKNVQ